MLIAVFFNHDGVSSHKVSVRFCYTRISRVIIYKKYNCLICEEYKTKLVKTTSKNVDYSWYWIH